MDKNSSVAELEKSDFDWFRRFIEKESGISIKDNKQNFLYNRLVRRIKCLGVESFKEYRHLLQTEGNRKGEIDLLFDAIVTPESSFFRYQPHFNILSSTILPDLVKRRVGNGLTVNVLSMGCASGEEPYSLAMLFCENLSMDHRHFMRISAADLSRSLLARAKEGYYSEGDAESIPYNLLRRYFIKEGHGYRVISRVSRMIKFFYFNMTKGGWSKFHYSDLIFCRNTIIYFCDAARKQVLMNLFNCLRAGGYLILGHTEFIDADEFRVEHVGNTVYRKELG